MKQLSEFSEIEDGKAELTLMAYALSAKEQKEALEVETVMRELEKKGWVWE